MSEALELARLIEERIFLGREELGRVAAEDEEAGFYQDLSVGDAKLIAKLVLAVRAAPESS